MNSFRQLLAMNAATPSDDSATVTGWGRAPKKQVAATPVATKIASSGSPKRLLGPVKRQATPRKKYVSEKIYRFDINLRIKLPMIAPRPHARPTEVKTKPI